MAGATVRCGFCGSEECVTREDWPNDCELSKLLDRKLTGVTDFGNKLIAFAADRHVVISKAFGSKKAPDAH